MESTGYQLLIKKLDEFIRKYYLNQIIRGSILFASLGVALFLAIVLLEYLGKFNSSVRTVLFYGFAISTALIFIILIARPLLKILAIGKRISHEKASQIIGKHFSEVNDKLFNVLQLQQQANLASSNLIAASIDQKIGQLKPVPFGLAVNLKENKRYLKYLLFPSLIILGLAAFEPKIIKDSTQRIVSHSQEFIPQAPYSITIENKQLQSFKNEDYSLRVKLEGEELPNNLSIIFSGQRFLMSKSSKSQFQYQFKNLQNDLNFTLFDGEFESKSFSIKVLPQPLLSDFLIELNFPPYLKKEPVSLKNTGDIEIPQGTHVKWTFYTSDTDSLFFIEDSTTSSLNFSGENEFIYSKRFYQSTRYGLFASNRFVSSSDTINYFLQVIPDLRPSIEVDPQKDSLDPKLIYFSGLVKDDYGFSRLVFHSQFRGKNDSIGEAKSTTIPINLSLKQTDFFFTWNTAVYHLKAGDEIEYYFEIWDNDGVNGSKSARTQKFSYKAPSKEELSRENKETEELVKKELEESIRLSEEIKRDLESLKEKLLDKKELGFQEKKQLKALLEKQKKVQESLKKLNAKNEKNNRMQQEFSPQDEALLEKQKQVQELFENIMTDEMKEMMQQIEKMMDQLKKEDLQKELEKMELSNEELEKELDRNLELFKQLELEKKINEAKEQLDQIKKEQTELKEETKEKKESAEELKEKQENLEEKFEELGEKLDDIEKKNQELEEPKALEDTESLEEDIKEDMKKSAEELSKKNEKKSSESQESAEQKMQQLSEKLEDMQSQMQSQSSAENLEDLRAILENLIQLSFDQEDVMETLKATDQNDPQYVNLAQKQKKLKDDSKVIEDSLFALSKRVVQLESIINKEITAVNFNMKKAIEDMGERKTPSASARQQLSMTSINNLALLLDEAIQSMQMQMQMQQGKGKCEKPGGGKPSPGGMKKLQQQLNKQMQELKEAMEKGQKPGGKEGGMQGQKGQGKMSKELAQMAAKQAAIRKAVEELQNEIGESNGQSGGNLKKLGELMEQTETDLVNKQITNETLLRQQEILTRLLQSEKAEREREKDEKREATEFVNEFSRNPKSFLEYNRRKEKEIELLKTLPPSFHNFYKTKVSEYFNQLEK